MMTRQKCCTVYWLFLVSLTCSVVINGQVDVTFIPSPPITTVDKATYSCSSNHPAVLISWFIGNSQIPTHDDDNLTLAGVITNGGGTSTSSLIVPGYLTQLNDTLIYCLASGRIGGPTGTQFDELRSAPLLIQGKLDGVGDLMTQPDGPCCINITWSPPYTLSGVPILGYNINITQYDQLIVSNTTDGNTTEWRYCPEKSGEYIISVGAVNGVGEGNITSGMIEESTYNVAKVELEHLTLSDCNGTLCWMVQVNISVNGSVCINRIKDIKLKDTVSSLQINTTSIADDTNSSNVIATFTLYVNQFNFTYHTFILYSVGDTDNTITINFRSVINVTVDIQSDNIVFTCHFISGSFATGCHIRLFQDDSLLHNITVTRQDNDITGSTSLPKDSISSGTYTIEVYDEYTNGLILPNIVYSTTITITIPDVLMSSQIDLSSTITVSILPTPTWTPGLTNGSYDTTVVVVLPVSIVILLIIIIIIIIITVLSAIITLYKRSNKKIDNNPVHLNYINVDHNNPQSRPIPPLPAEPVAVHDAVIHTSTNPCYDDVILSSPNVTPNDAYGVIYIKT